ncbi:MULTISPECIES: class I SAM-dependent methyltransferase [Streptomyces]|uniref:class I SAM-dependent methyltransferase n=1 Tax=Streptomyces TaxID=1883 RepID=UPI00103ED458|nr:MULTISPECIES: class I SAM-dependent methyltransferase [Streptomyces]MBT3075108.1 class I SAM-dependent methyltransferase [Streptomyces sp. COG21]MBT3088932.1 class I SAM-dependent methyltransferase [Streptomyces sp. CYG21]MBT3096549.1 class I SAM-dependent methyltransferase [Streptomyces sp. CBG30]MBT3103936.1 class I SAM-dependent methyltransferase [Streptomyces sp. COG19]MBT3113341.1 class I SAM-dependent methyltransferase [Streptomyces sp. CYG20]
MVETAHRNTGVEGVAGGVGVTALLVAAARAIETHRADSLAQDVFAEHFVLAAPASKGWPVRPAEVTGGDANPLWGRFARYFGLRTRVLDDFLLGSAHTGGVRQVVLVGAGLDSRAYRLEWPAGCVVFEIDREEVLAFKHQVLDGVSAAPKAARVPVPMDLRDDWAGALPGAGFDPAAPSVWLIEGLLFYLPPAAETYLVDTVDRLTAGGSALAFEAKLEKNLLAYRDSALYTATREQIGIDLLDLFDLSPRPDSVGRLAERGWSTAVHTPFDFTRLHGRGPLPEPNDALAGNRWVFADKPRGS